MTVELHAAMRFTWLWKKSTGNDTFNEKKFSKPVFIACNAIRWILIILPFAKVINYNTGFIPFTIVTVVKLIANIYRDNVPSPKQAVKFPFRIP